MRWRYGDTNPVIAAADSATVIEIGDLVWQDTDDAKPASSLAWDTSLAKTQDNLADKFLGVAMQRSRSGEAVPVRVAASGVFEFDCDAATFELGDLVGAAKAAGNALLPQKIVKVTDPAYAIGRVAKRAAAATSVLVAVQSVVMYGGLRGATTAAG
jgi:uncharacterized ferredoxin-like protein